MAQTRLIVMRLPIGARAPLRLGLAGGDVIGDLNCVKAHAAGPRVLVGNHRTHGAQLAFVAQHPQAARDGEAATAPASKPVALASEPKVRKGGADVIFDTTGFWLPAAVAGLAPFGRIAIIAAPVDGHVQLPALALYRKAPDLYDAWLFTGFAIGARPEPGEPGSGLRADRPAAAG